MQIRPGTPADASAIDAFNCFDCDSAAALEQGRCLVAQVEDKIAGFVIYKRKGLIGKNFVEYLVVDEAFRRQGGAVALLQELEQTLSPCRLFISTEAGNKPMLALLQKNGWHPAGQIDHINKSGFAEVFFYRDVGK